MSNKHRLQLDFTEEALRTLDELKDKTGLANRAEVIRQSLRLLQWTIQQNDDGSVLLLEKNGRRREVVFPFLAHHVGG